MAFAGSVFMKDGENFKLRFFEPRSFQDLKDLREIIQSPGVQEWMDSVSNMSHKHYMKWMGERGQNEGLLLAIAGSDSEKKDWERVHGFIYVYPSVDIFEAYEVSYAKRPGSPSGLVTPALRETLKVVNSTLGQVKLVAEIERGNQSSIKVVEAAGFRKYKDFDREGNGLWRYYWN